MKRSHRGLKQHLSYRNSGKFCLPQKKGKCTCHVEPRLSKCDNFEVVCLTWNFIEKLGKMFISLPLSSEEAKIICFQKFKNSWLNLFGIKELNINVIQMKSFASFTLVRSVPNHILEFTVSN